MALVTGNLLMLLDERHGYVWHINSQEGYNFCGDIVREHIHDSLIGFGRQQCGDLFQQRVSGCSIPASQQNLQVILRMAQYKTQTHKIIGLCREWRQSNITQCLVERLVNCLYSDLNLLLVLSIFQIGQATLGMGQSQISLPVRIIGYLEAPIFGNQL